MVMPSQDRFGPLTSAHPVDPRSLGAGPVVMLTVVELFREMVPALVIFARSTPRRTKVPDFNECTRSTRPQDERTALPFTATISSATCNPAVRAGEGATTPVMMDPV